MTAALNGAAHEVFWLDGLSRPTHPELVDQHAADLVVVGNPTNPTGVLHPAATIRALCRPGRLVVVDEAFMDAVPGESESLAAEPADGLLVIRSLTTTGDGRSFAPLIASREVGIAAAPSTT